MKPHYDDVVASIDMLRRTIQQSSLNRLEFNNIRSMLHEIYEQTLPNTLTWVPEEKEPEKEIPLQKKVFNAFGVPFREQLKKLRL